MAIWCHICSDNIGTYWLLIQYKGLSHKQDWLRSSWWLFYIFSYIDILILISAITIRGTFSNLFLHFHAKVNLFWWSHVMINFESFVFLQSNFGRNFPEGEHKNELCWIFKCKHSQRDQTQKHVATEFAKNSKGFGQILHKFLFVHVRSGLPEKL